MDDFTPDDMPGAADFAEMLRRMLGGGVDPVALREHEMAHLTDDLEIPRDEAVRLYAIREWIAEQRTAREAGVTDYQDGLDTPAKVIRVALGQNVDGALDQVFAGIHQAESAGVPLDAIADLDTIRRRVEQFLGAWDLVATMLADEASVTVPDDVSSLVTE